MTKKKKTPYNSKHKLSLKDNYLLWNQISFGIKSNEVSAKYVTFDSPCQ